jgi:5-methyltetrahydrofolate--homocysteine methyltransferase
VRRIHRQANPAKPRFVAGVLGPTSRTASISPDVNDPGYRNVTFDELVDDLHRSHRGLTDGGADILLVETVFDTLNAKAALFAIEQFFDERRPRWPVMISGHDHRRLRPHAVGPDRRGLLELAEPHPAAVVRPQLRARRQGTAPVRRGTVARLRLLRLGPPERRPAQRLRRLRRNAGTCWPMKSPTGRSRLREHRRRLLRHLAGPHRAIAEAVAGQPAPLPEIEKKLRLSGLEPFNVGADSLFVNVGERTNVTGSKAFARMILEGRFDDALAVARQQVENGAQVIDINMDEAMLDSKAAMDRFLKLIASEPDISRVPIMIDSSKWEVIEAGLKCIQGKGIVNSISMKEGEAKFLEQAKLARRYGAAVIVMAFDEKGQADTYARKTEICEARLRSAGEHRFPARRHHLRPEHLRHRHRHRGARQLRRRLHRGLRWIKQNLPHAQISGGVSNVSFSFRGNDPVREAIHTVFLYHAIKAGMSMGIVNAGMLGVYDDLEPVLREKVEDVVLNRNPGAGEALVEFRPDGQGRQGQGHRPRSEPGASTAGRESAWNTRWSRASPTSSWPTPRNAAPRWKPKASRRCR